jgi:UMF1 family MFS transporter
MDDVAEKLHRRAINAWCMYDWANSAFVTTVTAAVLPPFYSRVAAAGLPANTATAYWGYTSAIALLISAVAAPILGAIADYSGIKKRLLAIFALVGILFTALLYFVTTGDWLKASIFYVIAEVGFGGSIVFYDALLPHVARHDEIDQVSSKGYALGYLGGGLLLAINLGMIMKPDWFLLSGAEMATRVAFVTVAVWWAVFSIPLLRTVPEPPASRGQDSTINPITGGFRRLGSTFRELRRYRELTKFIVAFWLYNDGIGTIIKMATVYGAEIGISTNDLVAALLLTQFIGIPFSLLFGRLARRLGTKNSIFLALAVYTLISIAGYFMTTAWQFYALAVAVGFVQGGSQALSRSLFGVMVPKTRTGEFFGFYDVSSKIAGIVGPALFGIVGQLAGSSRLSIISLIVFFIAGGALLTTVKEKEGIAVAREMEAREAGADERLRAGFQA